MNPLFSPSQFAAGLGVTAKTVRKALSKVAPAGEIEVRGKPVDAWTVLQLPHPWIAALDKAAAKFGCNAEQFLTGTTLEEPEIQTPQPKPARPVENIPGVAATLAASRHPITLNRPDREGIWNLALGRYKELLGEGTSPKDAEKIILAALFRQVPQLAASRETLRKLFKFKLVKGARDGRRKNGNHFQPPQEDVDRLRHSTVQKNGGRFDTAWREEYEHLSDYTRGRYAFSWTMPPAMVRLVNRDMTDAIRALNQGKPALNVIMGGLRRKNDIPSMHRWVVDDLTATIETSIQTPEGISLILPQIIITMDSASRMITGWSVAPDKAPTAELACEAVLNGFEKYGIPINLHIENGFVFGRSLNVNGKTDAEGNTIVAGLASYGCKVRHFEKRNPQSKGELEKAFDLFQRQFERHPGYTGRIQMFDASDKFKREQRAIRAEVNAGTFDGTNKRYTYQEFAEIVLPKLIFEYNNTPRQVLNGLSPAEEFERRRDPSILTIHFNPELRWLLANERYLVKVKPGGVTIRHYGRTLRVRGEQLARFIGSELRAVVSRRDDSLVTFMKKDFSEPFTMEVCRDVSIDETGTAPHSGILAAERGKIGEHVRAVREERNRLMDRFGDTGMQLLNEVRSSASTIVIGSNLEESGAQMEQQRAEIIAQKELAVKKRKKTLHAASCAGAHPSAVGNPEKLAEITNLLKDDERHNRNSQAVNGAGRSGPGFALARACLRMFG
jgi:hypothetical protein